MAGDLIHLVTGRGRGVGGGSEQAMVWSRWVRACYGGADGVNVDPPVAVAAHVTEDERDGAGAARSGCSTTSWMSGAMSAEMTSCPGTPRGWAPRTLALFVGRLRRRASALTGRRPRPARISTSTAAARTDATRNGARRSRPQPSRAPCVAPSRGTGARRSVARNIMGAARCGRRWQTASRRACVC